MKKAKWILVGVLLIAAAVGGLWWRSRGPDASARPSGPATEPVEVRSIEIAVEASGVLEPIRVVEVKSRASGEVRNVHAETGMRVDAGTLLAEIDPRDVENAYQQAVADLDAARVKASTTSAHRDRLKALKDSGVVTLQEYESAVDAAASARATLVRSETNLQLARERRGDSTIRAPISGTIIERTAEIGQIIASATSNVSGGTTLFKMADLGTMQVRAKIDETDIGQIAAGQEVSVTVDAYPARPFRGTVYKVEPQSVVEQNVTMFPVLVRLDNQSGLLRPGMNAEVRIEIAQREDVPTIPTGAVVTMKDARAVAKTLGVPEEAVSAALRSSAPNGDDGDAAAVDGAAGAAANTGPGALTASARSEAGAPAPSRQECAELRRSTAGDGAALMTQALRAKLAVCEERAKRRGESLGAAGAGAGQVRPAVVFVQTPGGVVPRRVVLGLSDLDFAEVVRGVDVGERVVLVSAAQLQQRQQQMNERLRSGPGSLFPGAGGRGGGARGAGRGG